MAVLVIVIIFGMLVILRLSFHFYIHVARIIKVGGQVHGFIVDVVVGNERRSGSGSGANLSRTYW